MAGLSDTLARLARAQAATASAYATDAPAGGRLRDLGAFGSNPGALRALAYVPTIASDDSAGMPLVVVLHGCTQTAAGYDQGAGWSDLAEQHGFAVLFPEQQRGNNGNLCFNWFAEEDIRRDGGEALSIRQMIATMVRNSGIDTDRIYITGLSAGGAMTAVMLATYPEVFAAGAIIAGLPYGTATSMSQALTRMRGRDMPDPGALSRSVRDAAPAGAPVPRVSVWHGDDDATVVPANGDAVVAQWRGVHGVAATPDETGQVAGHVHRVWHDAAGQAVVEEYRIRGLGHGTPLATSGADAIGQAGPHMFEAGICSTRHSAAFFGLVERPIVTRTAAPARPADARPAAPAQHAFGQQPGGGAQIGAMIDGALRAAGLLR